MISHSPVHYQKKLTLDETILARDPVTWRREESIWIKNWGLLTQIVVPYLPRFGQSADLIIQANQTPHWFNVDGLIEETIAHVGNLVWCGGDHADFGDGSDAKTGSINVRPRTPNGKCFTGQISSVITRAGSHKTGSLRCVIWNPHTRSCEFFFIPLAKWSELTRTNNSGIGEIRWSWNSKTGQIARLEPFRIPDFLGLCEIR